MEVYEGEEKRANLLLKGIARREKSGGRSGSEAKNEVAAVIVARKSTKGKDSGAEGDEMKCG